MLMKHKSGLHLIFPEEKMIGRKEWGVLKKIWSGFVDQSA